jgi:hypothetical protein
MKNYKPDLSRYAGINPNKLPREWSPFYVVYKYSWTKSTYIVSFDTDEAADKFQKEILGTKDLTRCEIFGHYPLDLLKEEN